MASFNKSVLDAALKSRSLSEERLSKRIGYTFHDYREQIGREGGPSKTFLNTIAKELSVPPFVFFMKTKPRLENNLVDFRHPNPHATEKSPETMSAIQVAHSVQREAERLNYKPQFNFDSLEVNQSNAEKDAKRIRAALNITVEDQRAAKDARLFYYFCRKRIEENNVFVLQDSFPSEDGSGFALGHAHYPVIVVNSYHQNYARRLFTLIHEFAHILIGKSGISDPFVRRNDTERYCNKFAVEFLAPEEIVSELLKNVEVPRSPTTADVRRIANRLKISQQATILRLEQLNLVNEGSHATWLRLVSNLNPDFKSSGGGNGRPDEYKIKYAKYGYKFASYFERAIEDKAVSDIELYRIAGIKPRWLPDFFTFARDGSVEDIDE